MKERINNSHGLLAIVVIALIVVTVSGPLRTFYNAAINPPEKTIYQLYGEADMVLDVQALSQEDKTLMIGTKKAFKGKKNEAPAKIALSGDCVSYFTIGETYVVFLHQEPGQYAIDDCYENAHSHKSQNDAEFMKTLPNSPYRR